MVFLHLLHFLKYSLSWRLWFFFEPASVALIVLLDIIPSRLWTIPTHNKAIIWWNYRICHSIFIFFLRRFMVSLKCSGWVIFRLVQSLSIFLIFFDGIIIQHRGHLRVTAIEFYISYINYVNFVPKYLF